MDSHELQITAHDRRIMCSTSPFKETWNSAIFSSLVRVTRHQSRRSLRLLSRVTCHVLAPLLAFQIGTASRIALAQQTKRPFTVADGIGLITFGGPEANADPKTAVCFSPDGNYVAVETSRGRLDLNRVEDSLRFYRSRDIKTFLESSTETQPPVPIWSVRLSGENGPVITKWRWLADSSGMAFLQRIPKGRRLVLADLRRKTAESLTSATQVVGSFDIHDRQHYVYTSASLVIREKTGAGNQAPMIVGTGHSLEELLSPDDPTSQPHPSYLWAVIDGNRFEVKHNGAALLPKDELALSVDNKSLVTTLLITDIPVSWRTLYPPPYPSSPYGISPDWPVTQYVRIILQTGSVQSLTDAPSTSATSSNVGWTTYGSPNWSHDGQKIILPGTFIKSKDNAPSRPCVAVVDLPSNTRTCVEMLKGRTETSTEEAYHTIVDVHFTSNDNRSITVTFYNHGKSASYGATEYRRKEDGTWKSCEQVDGLPKAGHGDFSVYVKQAFDQRPQLIAESKQRSRLIWDPNPDLKDVAMGQASVYTWKDKDNRAWRGALFVPSDYKFGQRYPLVIQTHGFVDSEFRPSGLYPTAFAARALAGAGMIVLQAADEQTCPIGTPEEGPCAVSGYEAVVHRLVSEGFVDPDRIGIIGFSRTCFYVMEALTTSSVHFRAVSLTDGIIVSYLNYILQYYIVHNETGISHELDPIIGAAPFGDGLQRWVNRAPGFNLDKINSPLLIVSANHAAGLLDMWEPYAGLRYLHKPVDLVVLCTHEHIVTNPSVQLASQGGSVDWFRFWLKNEEDSAPTKADQYSRWRRLRKLEKDNETKLARPSAASH
jgi:dipeptidyl aminopeptidase/acylaminoacyl peptidase